MDIKHEELSKINLEGDEEELNGDNGKGTFLGKKDSSAKKRSLFDFKFASFKEDSYLISDLRESEKKALHEFKERIENAIKANQFLVGASEEDVANDKKTAAAPNEVKDERPTNQNSNSGQNGGGAEKHNGHGKNDAEVVQSHDDDDDVSMWGVPLLPTKGDERTDVILLKFLRARDFRVNDAFIMLQNCVAWRKKFGADNLLDEDLAFDDNLESVAFMHCYDKEGHPVCYNAYGIFCDKDLYQKIFGDDEKLKKFLRWRVQVLEKGIKLLNFRPGGVNAMIQITDLKNMPKRELRAASNKILALFQDNYPEMVAKKLFINVPWYFSALYSMFSPFLTQRTKSKFVIAREGRVPETLYKFISPENVPIQYGGLSKPKDGEFGPNKPAAEFTIKGGEKINLEIDGVEAGATILWDLVVGGWEVTYWAEFVPSARGSYTTVVDKNRKLTSIDEPVCNSFKASEAGKVVLIIDNSLSRKKKVAAYRYMVKKNLI
uniref:CRAL-TRIO domain-containing protein n=1 Tax=Araucaria cunninghamii TaxID=56994 RepID=A0A0D6R818_ARACU